jgi:hypothetical protein
MLDTKFDAGNSGEEETLLADKHVLVGLVPELIALTPQDQAEWLTSYGTLKVEFDPKRCPFGSNVFQAPAGMRLLSGPPSPGAKPGSYKYRVALNDVIVGTGEIVVRE